MRNVQNRRRTAGVALLAAAALAVVGCTSSSDGATSSATSVPLTTTTAGGVGPAVRVSVDDPRSVGRLFEAWAIGQDADGFIGECVPDRASMPADTTWCSTALGAVTDDGQTFWLGHPGAAEAHSAVLVAERDGYFVIADQFALGDPNPPVWVGTGG